MDAWPLAQKSGPRGHPVYRSANRAYFLRRASQEPGYRHGPRGPRENTKTYTALPPRIARSGDRRAARAAAKPRECRRSATTAESQGKIGVGYRKAQIDKRRVCCRTSVSMGADLRSITTHVKPRRSRGEMDRTDDESGSNLTSTASPLVDVSKRSASATSPCFHIRTALEPGR